MIYNGSINKKRFTAVILSALVCISTLFACSPQSTSSTASTGKVSADANETNSTASAVETSVQTDISVAYDSDDEDSDWNNSEASGIVLNGNTISFNGTGAAVDGSKITITSGGTYIISGTLTNGQIRVDTEDKKTVKLILNGTDITCTDSAPIYIVNAKKVVVTLANGTENKITDGNAYVFEDTQASEPNAAIFSKSDLTINGSGLLTVNANYNDAIACKDELKIISGNITINSAADGIRGRDYVAVKNAAITINAKGDGIKSTNDEDSLKGFVYIDKGNTISITSGTDGIQAETSILILGGNIDISSGGGSANGINTAAKQTGMNSTRSNSTAASTKGIKAAVNVQIEDGTIHIDSADDAIHSNGSISINSGNITIASGDDGIHADATLNINGGDISISKSYEGIESAVITINDGSTHIVSSDDGINVAGGNDSSAVNGRPGQNSFAASSNNYLTINGGYTVLDAMGDGLDSNGSISMTGGVVIVNGPTANDNGALDYNGSFKATGGFLVAAGSSGMAQAPDTSSTQCAVSINFSSSLSANTLVHIENEKGEDVLTFAPTKNYQSLVLCSAQLTQGATYNIYTGGSSTGTVKDGLYSDGIYTAGTKFTSLTISSIITTAGSANNAARGPAVRR